MVHRLYPVQRCPGRSDKDRFFAQVKVGERDLAEELVRNGLARIFGQGTDLSDGTRSTTFWWRLKTAEREAKRNRLGAFSADVETAFVEARQTKPRHGSWPFRSSPSGISCSPTPSLCFHLGNLFSRLASLRAESRSGLGAVSASMVRVRFTSAAGQLLEGQCRRIDLGL